MKQWIRVINLKAGGKEIKNLGDAAMTMEFRVPFNTDTDKPDVSEVKVYNLSNSTIAAIESQAYLILDAGYREDFGNILSGKIDTVQTEWRETEKITTITASDGGFEWRKAKIQKTYQKGSKASYIMKDLVSVLGYEVGEIEPKNDLEYKLGKSISGSVETALRGIVKDTNSKMYIDKNKIYIRDKKKGTDNGFVVSSESGMVGSPEKIEEEDDKGKKTIKYKVKMLLNYKITKDSLIQIKSKTINGNYRVESGEHRGSEEGEFVTEVVVVPA